MCILTIPTEPNYPKNFTEAKFYPRLFYIWLSKIFDYLHWNFFFCFRYDKVEEILRDFYELRLKYYARRKEYREGQLQAEAEKLSNQARFILEKCDKDLVVENKKRKVMVEELIKRGMLLKS